MHLFTLVDPMTLMWRSGKRGWMEERINELKVQCEGFSGI